MRRADDLTTRPLPSPEEDEEPMSEVWLAGASTGKRVPGAFLEAAVAWKKFYLLFMTDDVPFEEMLRIILLDHNLTVVDSAMLGGIYTTGNFSSLELVEPNTVRFEFIGNTTWTVELLPKPHFRLPFIWDAPGVWRRLGFSRHFIVHGNPQPQD